MLYFKSRSDARAFASKSDNLVVVDCKDNLSANGSRWAVSASCP